MARASWGSPVTSTGLLKAMRTRIAEANVKVSPIRAGPMATPLTVGAVSRLPSTR